MRLSTTPDLAGAPEPADGGYIGLFLGSIGAGSISSSLHLLPSWTSMNYHRPVTPSPLKFAKLATLPQQA